MLPRKLRLKMFDSMSSKTMRRFFHPVTPGDSEGLARQVLEQSQRDFFVNGTITGHGACPELMAGMWAGGRETALVSDQLEAWLKKAMGAALSQENQCPYCEDMLISLTLGAREIGTARAIDRGDGDAIDDPFAGAVIAWTRAAGRGDRGGVADSPFSEVQLPEAIGTILVFSYTNKISDFLVDGSPVPSKLRGMALRFFGRELRESSAMTLEPGLGLDLVPEAGLPDDMGWAAANPRVAAAAGRWAAVVEAHIDRALSPEARAAVIDELERWDGSRPPLSRAWLDETLGELAGEQQTRARLALLIARASYQCDDAIIEAALDTGLSEAGLVALGSFGALRGSRRIAAITAAAVAGASKPPPEERAYREA